MSELDSGALEIATRALDRAWCNGEEDLAELAELCIGTYLDVAPPNPVEDERTNSREVFCGCGHSAHWHAPDGTCEHDGRCECRELVVPDLSPSPDVGRSR